MATETLFAFLTVMRGFLMRDSFADKNNQIYAPFLADFSFFLGDFIVCSLSLDCVVYSFVCLQGYR